MKIPKKLKIAGHTYEVVTGHNFNERADLDGLCSSRACKILVGDGDPSWGGMAASARAVVFLHEVIHAILDRYGTVQQEHDEKLVDAIAEGLYQVIKDNKLRFDLD